MGVAVLRDWGIRILRLEIQAQSTGTGIVSDL